MKGAAPLRCYRGLLVSTQYTEPLILHTHLRNIRGKSITIIKRKVTWMTDGAGDIFNCLQIVVLSERLFSFSTCQILYNWLSMSKCRLINVKNVFSRRLQSLLFKYTFRISQKNWNNISSSRAFQCQGARFSDALQMSMKVKSNTRRCQCTFRSVLLHKSIYKRVCQRFPLFIFFANLYLWIHEKCNTAHTKKTSSQAFVNVIAVNRPWE